MAKQIYFEDVEVGAELPPLIKHPTTQQLVKWAGASDDYYQIHYDKDFAMANNLPGVIVHGWLTFSFLGQLVTDWMGYEGELKKIGCSYRGMNFPNQDTICKGKVTKKYDKDGQHFVELEIKAENPKGEVLVPGNATVVLPTKKK